MYHVEISSLAFPDFRLLKSLLAGTYITRYLTNRISVYTLLSCTQNIRFLFFFLFFKSVILIFFFFTKIDLSLVASVVLIMKKSERKINETHVREKLISIMERPQAYYKVYILFTMHLYFCKKL